MSLTVSQSIELVLWNLDSWLGLAPQRHDGLSRVSTNDWDDSLAWVLLASVLLNKCLRTHNIEGGDTEQLLRVKDAGALENLGCDWNGAVDWVGDDEDVGLRAELGDTLDKVAYDSSVDLEEVVASHAWLAWSGVSSAMLVSKSGIVNVRGMPAGMTTMSAPVKAFFMPSSFGRKPSIFCKGA